LLLSSGSVSGNNILGPDRSLKIGSSGLISHWIQNENVDTTVDAARLEARATKTHFHHYR